MVPGGGGGGNRRVAKGDELGVRAAGALSSLECESSFSIVDGKLLVMRGTVEEVIKE